MPLFHIQKVLNYIEEHLKDDSALNNAALAGIAGYSEYHFLRIFHKYVKLTPADYIRKRRISEIVKQISKTENPVSEIAFEYGFNSKENFTRAFKKEHRILPTEFRTANCSLRLFEPFDFNSEYICPTVSICNLEGFSLIAYPFGNDFPPDCWNRYNVEQRSLKLSGNTSTEDYGAMRWNFVNDCLDYYIGVQSVNAKGDIDGTVELNIQGGLYAVFETQTATQHDFVNTIRKTWDWISEVWLPQSGYKRKDGFELEKYIESSRAYSETIYIPITKE